jgi:hypothetical protein
MVLIMVVFMARWEIAMPQYAGQIIKTHENQMFDLRPNKLDSLVGMTVTASAGLLLPFIMIIIIKIILHYIILTITNTLGIHLYMVGVYIYKIIIIISYIIIKNLIMQQKIIIIIIQQCI